MNISVKNLTSLLLSIVVLLLLQACHNRHAKNYTETTYVDNQGLNFINQAIEGGFTEIKASGLALTKTSNQRVIGFAKMMINDHTKAGEELKKIKNDDLVIDVDTINADHQKMISNLASVSGRVFDKSYMQMMVNDHEKAVSLFAGATTISQGKIQNFAKKTLPTIQMHLDSAKAILASLK